MAWLGWLEKVHQLTHQNLLQKLAIISPLNKMLKVEVAWTVVAVLAGLGWLDKVHQITHTNLPQKIAIFCPFEMLKLKWNGQSSLFCPGLAGRNKCIN